MNLPTEQQCLDYFEQYKVPRHIKCHCLKVRGVAVFLAQELNQIGFDLDVKLVDRTSLLHDLFKVVALENLAPNKYHDNAFTEEETEMWKHLREKYVGMHETDVLHLVFKDEFPEFALVLKNHGNPLVEKKRVEENLVHYCDWRVFKEKIVSLIFRFDYCKETYPNGEKYWGKDIIKMQEFEKNLDVKLAFNLQELEQEMKKKTENRNKIIDQNER